MDNLQKYSLKGYFAELKEEVNRQAGKIEKDDINKVLETLKKAVGIIEEAYDKHPELLYKENANDYQQMIAVLNKHGYPHQGIAEIMDLSTKPSEDLPKKMPMQKAKGTKKRTDKGRKYGS